MREEHSIGEGLEIFADQPYKREIIEGVSDAAEGPAAGGAGTGGAGTGGAGTGGAGTGGVSTYRNARPGSGDGPDFIDLCRGPMCPLPKSSAISN